MLHESFKQHLDELVSGDSLAIRRAKADFLLKHFGQVTVNPLNPDADLPTEAGSGEAVNSQAAPTGIVAEAEAAAEKIAVDVADKIVDDLAAKAKEEINANLDPATK